MTPRRCQSCHGRRRPRLLQPSERPPFTCRSRPTPRGLVEFYSCGQWWNELAQLQSVRHRRPPRASLALCALIFAVTAAVVSWVLLRPLHAQRAGRRLSCAEPRRHLPLRRMQTRRDGSPVGNRPNTRFRPGDARSRHPACADDRMCQGWRSHHVVTSKTPFTHRPGSQTLRNEVAFDQAASGLLGLWWSALV
jgi:hypothetical protein